MDLRMHRTPTFVEERMSFTASRDFPSAAITHFAICRDGALPLPRDQHSQEDVR
jgi:hypothetical protein